MSNKPNNGEPEPKSRGGVRLKRGMAPASLANLKHWPRGVSGNPSGKSSSLNDVMRLARSHCPEAVERLVSIMRDKKAANRDVIAACLALLDRGCGKAIVPVYRGGTGLPQEMLATSDGPDGEMTALLLAAGKGAGDTYKRTLESELERLKEEEQQAKAARKDEIEEAAAAMANGQEVSPLMRMLVTVKKETS